MFTPASQGAMNLNLGGLRHAAQSHVSNDCEEILGCQNMANIDIADS